MRESLAAWHLRVPRLRATATTCARVRQSVADLAALRMRDGDRVVEQAARRPACPGS